MSNATAARHPLRARLELTERRAERRKAAARERDDNDIRLFVVSYTAFFICFYTFLL